MKSRLMKNNTKNSRPGSRPTPMEEWAEMEIEMNKRMKIVASNGNDGHHYWEDSWNDENED